MKKLLIAITAMLTLAATAMAEVKVAEAFSSHMVLQREKPVNVWGVADAGEKVKVSFGKQTLSTTADKAGLWRVTLKAMPANSRPQMMVISGRKNKIRLTDVLVGEVWLASGQSNMEYSMNNHPRYRKPQKGDADYQLKAWREANNPNTARYMANAMGGAVAQVSQVMHSFDEKMQVLNFAKNANNDTYMIDYVGGLKAGEYAREIVRTKYMATNTEPNFSTVTLYISATSGFFHFEIVRAFESSAYVDAFLEQLSRHGIVYAREPESRYVTPENGLITDLGLL
jgi:hypothetical protein